MAILAYARVSSTGQSLENQLEQLRKEKVEKVFKEKVSGSKWERPELMKLLDFMRNGDSVIVTKLDRIARNTKHLLELASNFEEKNVRFIVLNMGLDTATPQGKLIITVMGAIAEFELELLKERQAEGIARAKVAGKYKGRVPTARKKAPIVFQMLKEGVKNKREIAKELNIHEKTVYRLISYAKNNQFGLTPDMLKSISRGNYEI